MAQAKTSNGGGVKTAAFSKAVQAHRQVIAAQQALIAAKRVEHEAVIAFMKVAGVQDEESGLFSYKNPKTNNGWIEYEGAKYLPQHRKLGKGAAGEPRAFLRQPGDSQAGTLED